MTILGLDVYPFASSQLVSFKLDTAFFQSIEGVILPYANIISWMETGATLTYNDIARYYSLQNEQKNPIVSEVTD